MIRIQKKTILLSSIFSIVFVTAIVVYTSIDQWRFKRFINAHTLPAQITNTAEKDGVTLAMSQMPSSQDSNNSTPSVETGEVLSPSVESGDTIDPEVLAEANRALAYLNAVVFPEIDAALAELDAVLAESRSPDPADSDPFYAYLSARLDAGATEDEITNDPEFQRLVAEGRGISPPWEDENHISDAEMQKKLDYVHALIAKYETIPHD